LSPISHFTNTAMAINKEGLPDFRE